MDGKACTQNFESWIEFRDSEDIPNHDIVFAHLPLNDKKPEEIKTSFPIKTGDRQLLLIQHLYNVLKDSGRAGIIINSNFLSKTDKASIALRKKLLEATNLHTVLELPKGTFTGVEADVKAVVLFFDSGTPTQNIWFYQLNPNRRLTESKPLNEEDFINFIQLQKTKADSACSWSINIADVDKITYDL